MTQLVFARPRLFFINATMAVSLFAGACLAEEHAHEHGEEHTEETHISEKAIKDLQIEFAEAGPALVRETLSVTGRVALNQNRTAQVRARFPGVIRSVTKEPGEKVTEDELLATIESNESLQIYKVKSPLSGTVISRHLNVGEFAAEAPIFMVSDLSKLWAELFIFSKDGEKLQSGEKVHIQCLDDDVSAESTIGVVLPTTEISSQTTVARVVIDNPKNHWRPGMNIRADVVISEKEVPIAVKSEAIQRMEGNSVVFVEDEPNSYKAHIIETGISDGTWTEVRNGLAAGQRYVAKNSFIIKADIGKSSAEHEH